MTRSVMREHIFKILFRAEFYDAQEMTQQINYYLEEVPKVTEKEVIGITPINNDLKEEKSMKFLQKLGKA